MSTTTTLRGMVGRAARAPMLVKAGAGCGIAAGITIGVWVSAPAGLALGLVIGAAIGIAAGIVMDREDQRSAYRSRQLDEIIGVTSGSLGDAPRPSADDLAEAASRQRELDAWAHAWMTPPAPGVG